MKISEIIAAVREYPNTHADLELTRDELRHTKAALQEGEKERDQLLDDLGASQYALRKVTQRAEALSSVLHTFQPALQNPDALRQVYECVAPHMDEEGFRLYRAAESITGFDLYGSFPYEDARGEFEVADGHRLMGYLEAERFGTVDWDIVPGTSYERATSMEVNRDSQEYQAFQKQLYESVLRDMGFGDLLLPETPQQLHSKKEMKGRDAHAR